MSAQYHDIYDFTGNIDQQNPWGTVLIDKFNNLYSTTSYSQSGGVGIVFELAAGSNAFSVIHTFTGSDGAIPRSTLIQDAAGNLYGTTNSGGQAGRGTVYKIDATTHQETVLFSFSGWNGAFPNTGLAMDQAGNLYGTTWGGGGYDGGVAFEISASTHQETVLINFAQWQNSASRPTIDAAGNVFVSGFYAGAHGAGALYKIAAGTHAVSTVHDFNGTDGQNPQGSVTLDAAGNIFGTTTIGGAYNYGTVYEIDKLTNTETVLHSFNKADGASPAGGLLLDAAGNLFGIAELGGTTGNGAVFKIAAGTHTETVLYNFDGTTGTLPVDGLAVDASGNLYGTTIFGGAYGNGTVFKLTDTGFVTGASVLTKDFTGDGLAHNYVAGPGDVSVLLGSGGGSVKLGAGTDIVIGGTSRDTVTFGSGIGSFTGGAGNDVIQFIKGNITDASSNGGHYDVMTDFQLLANAGVRACDFIWLNNGDHTEQQFSAATTITYDHDLTAGKHIYAITDGAYVAKFELDYAGPGVQLNHGQWSIAA